MLDRSIPLGKLFGIPIRLHVLFLALLGLQVAAGFIVSKEWALFWFILLGPILLATVLIHELGHSLAARSVGGEAHGILLWPLGGLAFIGHTAGPKADMWVAFAGPLTHIPQVILYVLCLIPVHEANTGDKNISLRIPYPDSQHLGEAVLVGALLMNISLFAFNLLVPAYPLDGGRIFVDMLLTCGVPPVTTAKLTVGVAAPIALGIVIFGGVTFQVVTILVGLWILFSTFQLFDCVRKGEVQNHPMFADVCREGLYTTENSSYQQQTHGPNYV